MPSVAPIFACVMPRMTRSMVLKGALLRPGVARRCTMCRRGLRGSAPNGDQGIRRIAAALAAARSPTHTACAAPTGRRQEGGLTRRSSAPEPQVRQGSLSRSREANSTGSARRDGSCQPEPSCQRGRRAEPIWRRPKYRSRSRKRQSWRPARARSTARPQPSGWPARQSRMSGRGTHDETAYVPILGAPSTIFGPGSQAGEVPAEAARVHPSAVRIGACRRSSAEWPLRGFEIGNGYDRKGSIARDRGAHANVAEQPVADLKSSPQRRHSQPHQPDRWSARRGNCSPECRDSSNHAICRNGWLTGLAGGCNSDAIHLLDESLCHAAPDPCRARDQGQPRSCAAGGRIADAVHRGRRSPRG